MAKGKEKVQNSVMPGSLGEDGSDREVVMEASFSLSFPLSFSSLPRGLSR